MTKKIKEKLKERKAASKTKKKVSGTFTPPKRKVVKPKRKVVKNVESDGIEDDFYVLGQVSRGEVLRRVTARTFQVGPPVASNAKGHVMDAALPKNKAEFSIGNTSASDLLLNWYSAQGFIGSQTCALISQHWLVDKACTMPPEDAVRNGYRVQRNDGKSLTPDQEDAIRQADKEFRVKWNLVQYSRFSRIFGIRIMMFEVDVPDRDRFYENPFNIDGVPPNSYRGMSQIDPYWITPLLDADASGNPASMHFYEPTWWVVNGKPIHRTHLVITRTNEVPDVLKPTYVYAGVSIPQQIYERIYGAERTANEAPMLAMTKRTGVMTIDTSQAIVNQAQIERKLSRWAYLRDNYGIHAIGTGETFEQVDTALTDLDAIIMTQYQIVAAIARVPAVKLMGTSPKGFNASGEYEAISYKETLESIRSDESEPVLDRHHLLLIKSQISPSAPFPVSIKWNPLDVPTAEQKALVEKSKAETDQILVSIGAIDGKDVRKRIAADPDSNYSGMDVYEEPPSFEGGESEVGPFGEEPQEPEHFEQGNDPDYEEKPENEGNPDEHGLYKV